MRKLIFTILLFFILYPIIGQQPIAQWLFENNAKDSVGTYHGVIRGVATYNSTYKKQGTYSLFANGGRFVSPSINLAAGSGFTISMWVKIPSTSGFYELLNNGVAGSGSRIVIFTDAALKYIRIRTNNGVTENDIISANGVYTTDTWFHFAARSVNPNGANATIWINGIQSGLDTTYQTGWLKNDSIAIGGNRGGGSLYGYVDNVQIYTYGASAVQIDSLYDNGATSFILGNAGGGAPPPPPPPAEGDTSTLYKNFALDRHFILSGDASDGNIVGELQIAAFWDTVSTVSYSLQYDTSGYFSVSGDSLIIDDISEIQNSKWYRMTYKINDGDLFDSAYVYVYKPPADSCVTVTNWNTQTLNAHYYYFQARGTSLTITSTIDFPYSDVYCGAIGNGVRPLINKGFDNGGSAEQGIFTPSGTTDVWIQSFSLRPNGYSNTNLWYNDGIFASGAVRLTLDNLDINGYGADLTKFFSYSFRFYGPTNLVVRFCTEKYTLHGNWVSNCTGFRGTSNNHSHNDYYQDIAGEIAPSGGGADCWMFSNDPGGNDHSNLYFGYSYADKSSHPNKSGFIFGGSTDGTNDHDTVEWNRMVGYPLYIPAYAGAGIAMSGASGTVVRHNHLKNFGRGIFIFHETYTSWTNTNMQIYNNLIENSYYIGIQLTLESDGSKIYNNTFVNYGDSTTDIGNSAIALHGDNIDVKNNIFYDINGEEPFYGRAYPVSYNLYYDRVSHVLSTGEIEADPKFDSKYRLQYDSPAIDAGETLVISGYPGVDLKNDVVPYNSAWDMGAYEYVEVVPSFIEQPNTIFMKRRFIVIQM